MDKQEILDCLDIEAFYSSQIPSFKFNGSGTGLALCPFHEDTNPSFSVNPKTGGFRCFGCNAKGSIFDFVMKKNSLDFSGAKAFLAKEAGLVQEPKRKIAATYDYTDETGNLVFQTVRYEPKDFRQRRPDGRGDWIWNLKDVRLVLYNLPAVAKVKSVIIVEGERDVETLRGIGLVASCNAQGAGKWREEYNQHFQGKRIIILPDNDDSGRGHAAQVARNLKGLAESIKIVELPGLPVKGDVTNWVEAGGTKDELIEIISDTPEWMPEEPRSLLSSLLKWNAILDLDVKTEYLLERLIPKNSITLIFGRGGIGKTSLCMQIARAIANGLPFDSLQTMETPVYYVDFENPLAVLKERVEKIGRSENLYVWHISNEIQPPKLDSGTWELYKQLPPGLLIIDTLRASHLSDENDSRPMSLIMGRLKELREMGFTVLLLHHTPKGNDNTFKGSTAILDLCDHVLGLEEVKDLEGEHIEFDCQNLYRVGTRFKTRYEPHASYLTFIPDLKGFKVAVDPDLEKMEGIREILLESPEPLKQKELRDRAIKEFDLPDREVRRLLKKGAGLYWNLEKGEKNSTLYTPIKSVCQFDSTIYIRQTDKQESSAPEIPTNTSLTNGPQSLANTEFGSLTGGYGQTDKQGRCSSCFLTPGQRQLCEVVKPCPREGSI